MPSVKSVMIGLLLALLVAGPDSAHSLSTTSYRANYKTAKYKKKKSAKSCIKRCRTRHNMCRIRTKGSRRCDTKLRACLRRCVR